MQNKNIAIIIPTFNEVNNITAIIEKIFSLGDNFFVLVVDDNSPDGTPRVVQNLQRQYHNLNLMLRKEKMGIGSAYKDGFKYVLDRNYDIVIQMDADMSHDPSCIGIMLDLLDNYDLVIGSRYIMGGSACDSSFGRILLSRLANTLGRLMFGLPVRDLTSGFKCMKKDALERINVDAIISRGYFFQVELVFRSFLKGIKIVEYPIVCQGRSRGKSKMSFSVILEAFNMAIVLWYKKVFKKCLFR